MEMYETKSLVERLEGIPNQLRRALSDEMTAWEVVERTKLDLARLEATSYGAYRAELLGRQEKATEAQIAACIDTDQNILELRALLVTSQYELRIESADVEAVRELSRTLGRLVQLRTMDQ